MPAAMARERKPAALARKARTMRKPPPKTQEQRRRTPASGLKRRNANEPQAAVPHAVELPLAPRRADEVRLPAAVTGAHLGSGCL